MGGKASSNSQSFETFVKDNQSDFINELSHQNKKNKMEDINQSMIKNLQNIKYIIISTDKLQTPQHIWNKIDFSVYISDIEGIPIQINHYMKSTYKSFSFGIIRLDPITCSHIIFFLNKSKVFLSIHEFLNRILLSSNSSENELTSLIVLRKSPIETQTLKLDFPNPFLEPSLEQDMLQSSSCAFFQKSQSDAATDADSDHERTVKNDSFNNSQSLFQSEIKPKENKPQTKSIIVKEKSKDAYNYDQSDSSESILTFKSSTTKKKTNSQMKKKSNQKPTNKRNQNRNKKPIAIKFNDSEDNYDYYTDDDDNETKANTKKSHSPPLLKEKQTKNKNKKQTSIQKSDTDHLSSLFNFSATDSQSIINQIKSTDICIDFYDQSSSTNIQTFKNWLPKDENVKRKQAKSPNSKNNTKRKSTPQKTNQNPTSRNKSVHINLTSDFDKSIHLNNKKKSKRTFSSPRRKQRKKINKPSPQKTNSNKNMLGTLTSDFDMNSMRSKQPSMMTFKHDFNSSYEEEDYSSSFEIKTNSKIINTSLTNNTSRNIKDSNSNELNDSLKINSIFINENDEINQKIKSNTNEEKTQKRKKKNINQKTNNYNETENYPDANLSSNQQTDDYMNQDLQLKIPRIFDKRKTMNSTNSEVKLGQLASDFDFSASSVIRHETIFQNTNSLNYNQNREFQNKVLISNKSLGQLTSDFDISASSHINGNNQVYENQTHDINISSSKESANLKQIHRKRNTKIQKSINDDLGQLTSDFGNSLASANTNKTQRNNLVQNIFIRNNKNHLELSNNSLEQLTSDFDMNFESNLKNEKLNPYQQNNNFNPPKRKKKNKRNQSNFVANNFEEKSEDVNVNEAQNITRNRKKRSTQNKNLYSSSKRNESPNVQIETIHSNYDLGHLTSDFSTNI